MDQLAGHSSIKDHNHIPLTTPNPIAEILRGGSYAEYLFCKNYSSSFIKKFPENCKRDAEHNIRLFFTNHRFHYDRSVSRASGLYCQAAGRNSLEDPC